MEHISNAHTNPSPSGDQVGPEARLDGQGLAFAQMVRANAQQYLNDSRVLAALKHGNFMDINGFIKFTKFEIENNFDKLFDEKSDRKAIRAELKERLGFEYYLMIEELMGLYGAYNTLKISTAQKFNF